MKPIHIFRAGKHTASAGQVIEFTAADLQGLVDSYDPSLHEAPIVAGHPKDNGPAFGWVGGMTLSGSNVYATPQQLNADFAEQVQAGAYKKVSASLYTPDHPSNPKPGSYYLRHVGFLGAQPPAIKGLEAISFSDGEGDIVEFAAEYEVASVFRRLREFMIEKFGIEDADKAIPGWMVESTEDAARNPPKADMPSYSEGDTDPGANTMTEAELKAAQAKLDADKAAHDAAVAEFAEQEATRKAEAETARKAAIKLRVDDLVKAGKVTPANAEGIRNFAESLTAEQIVEFGEGDKAVKQSATDYFFALLEAGKSPVDFGEHGAPGGDDKHTMTSEELGRKAVEYREEMSAKGITISATQAVAYVQSQQA